MKKWYVLQVMTGRELDICHELQRVEIDARAPTELRQIRRGGQWHAPYQGHQYSKKAFDRINNSLARKFGWWGCRHNVYPIILGISPPAYSDKQLQQYLDENEKGVWYEGQHYTLYDAKSRKHELESLISQKKYDIFAAEGDAQLLKEKQLGLQILRQEYRRFCAATGQSPEA